MWQDFKKFIARGNVMDLAVAVILGAAFLSVVQSLVKDVIMPPLGLLLGNMDLSSYFIVLHNGFRPGPYPTLAAAQRMGAVTLNYGMFINTIVSFLIVAFVVYLLIRSLQRARLSPEVPHETAKRPCPYCLSPIPTAAARCGFCTSEVEPAP